MVLLVRTVLNRGSTDAAEAESKDEYLSTSVPLLALPTTNETHESPRDLHPTNCPRPVPNNRQPAMDSLPQETIDEIIDNLPRSSLRSSSLVAKRWRTRSQQRALFKVLFAKESMVNYWRTDIQSGSGGVSSYVQFAGFDNITEWSDPVLFISVVENFTSLTTLWISQTEIPSGVPERISHGDLGKKVTILHLRSPLCSLPTVISTIFAFPSLQNLFIDAFAATSGETLLTYPVLPRSEPLKSLQVTRSEYRIAEALANLQFASRSLILDVRTKTLQNLLALSPATVVELELRGVYSLRVLLQNYQ